MHEPTRHTDQASGLRRLTQVASPSRGSSSAYIWAVTSGKGGAGKSVFALNFAVTLAGNGRTVLLVDADENLAKLDVMVGLSPTYRIPDVLSGSVAAADAALNPMPNLYLLAGSSGSMNYPEITPQERCSFIRTLMDAFDGVTDIVFDTGAGIQEKVICYASSADQVIVVSQHEPVAVLDAYAVIKMITAKNPEASFNIIMNKGLSVTECDEAAEKLRTAAKHFLAKDLRYLGVIPQDPAVSRSIVQQSPLAASAPASSASHCIRSIALTLDRLSVPQRQYQQEAVCA